MKILKSIFGTKHDRDIKLLRPLIQKINSFEPEMEKLSDTELQAQTPKFKEMLKQGSTLDSILPEAFATVREASKRILKMRHFDVQLIGGIVLYQNKIAEMKTGEGKTLTATLPMYLHALTSKGAHLVTVNDYLASRDSEWMGQLYRWLGLTVGCIVADMPDDVRQEAYQCDITYGTNNEFAFDYLRDNMKFDLNDYVQREHNYCIVDEVDSILIDEARTPLLISGPSEEGTGVYSIANDAVKKLTVEKHFTLEEKSKSAMLTDDGISEIQKILKIEDLFNAQNSEILHNINQSLRAHHLFTLDVDYVNKEGSIIIVDEFTGRLKEGSRWSDGLHQAIEAKEGVVVKSENQTLASITFQNYFKLYDGLSGMTGTADTEAEEFQKIYSLDVVVIPTNLPMIRNDQADLIYKDKACKYKAVGHLIQELHKKGQPVLVGTIAIDSSEIISKHLKKLGVPHNVLNAKHHEHEAEIVSNAGQPGSVTIATNMAGRGTDIKLTDKTLELGGLCIIGTERHESRRIDNQLRGRSGRQGDPGASRFFLSLEDDLMRIFGSDKIKKFMTTLGMEDDEPIEHKMISNAIAKAQKKVETHNFEIRKHLLEYDDVMNHQRKVIYRLRKEILSDNDNMGLVHEMLEDVVENFIEQFRPEKKVPLDHWPWEEMNKVFKHTFFFEKEINPADCADKYSADLFDYFYSITKQQVDDKFSQYEEDQVKMALREILLSIFDSHWKDHLLSMDHLKEGISLRAYAQKDPLTEYKRESFFLFEEMKKTVKSAIIRQIFSVQFYSQEEMEEIKRRQQEQLDAQIEAHKQAQKMNEEGKHTPVRRSNSKIGRNDTCPCGSGKKYKHCHGA